MPNVTIHWLEGRTLEQKRKVIAGITDLLVEDADARREAVQVTFREMTKDELGSRRPARLRSHRRQPMSDAAAAHGVHHLLTTDAPIWSGLSASSWTFSASRCASAGISPTGGR